jgi:hypothetical protein
MEKQLFIGLIISVSLWSKNEFLMVMLDKIVIMDFEANITQEIQIKALYQDLMMARKLDQDQIVVAMTPTDPFVCICNVTTGDVQGIHLGVVCMESPELFRLKDNLLVYVAERAGRYDLVVYDWKQRKEVRAIENLYDGQLVALL